MQILILMLFGCVLEVIEKIIVIVTSKYMWLLTLKFLRWQGIGNFDEIPDRNKCDHYEISLSTYRGQPMAVGSKEENCAEVYDFKVGKWTDAPSYKFQDGSRSHLGKTLNVFLN